MRMYCLYIITNKTNNRKYLGITMNFNKRKNAHLGSLRRNKHHSIYLQNSFNKHGEDNFEFSILFDNLPKEKAGWLEEFYLEEYYDNVYNVSKKSSGGDLISYHPELEEIREKHRLNGIEWWNSLSEEERREHALKTSGEKNGMFGKTHSEEAREKISLTHTGRKHSEEARKNMSDAQKKRFEDPVVRQKQSEANRKRYENPEERRKTGEATRRVFAEKRARGDFDNPSPERIAKIVEKRFEFVYEGVIFKGWEEAVERTGLSVPTIRKRLIDDKYTDSYYITPPRYATEKTREKQSEAKKGATHSEETKLKMSEAGFRRYTNDYQVIMANGEVYAFSNRKYLNSFLVENYDMRTSTISNLLRSGEQWYPKKHIHKELSGMRIVKNE